MRISQEGLDFIKQHEGYRDAAYLDQAGVPTIGYGHTKGVKMGQTISAAHAENLLREDLRDAEDAVERLIAVPLNEYQHAALVSFVFNVGAGALASSTLRKKLNAGDYDAVPAELARWNKHTDPTTGRKVVNRGLANRRHAEAALWNSLPKAPVVDYTPTPRPVRKGFWARLFGG